MRFIRILLFIPLLIVISCTKSEPTLQGVLNKATFSDLGGNDVSLADYKGKVVLIDFWETWCGPCLQVFPAMDRLLEEYPDDFIVLAVNSGVSDDLEDAIKFSKQNSYKLEYLFDEYAVGENLGIYSIPFKIFIAPDGTLITSHLGSYGTEGDYEFAKKILLEHKS